MDCHRSNTTSTYASARCNSAERPSHPRPWRSWRERKVQPDSSPFGSQTQAGNDRQSFVPIPAVHHRRLPFRSHVRRTSGASIRLFRQGTRCFARFFGFFLYAAILWRQRAIASSFRSRARRSVSGNSSSSVTAVSIRGPDGKLHPNDPRLPRPLSQASINQSSSRSVARLQEHPANCPNLRRVSLGFRPGWAYRARQSHHSCHRLFPSGHWPVIRPNHTPTSVGCALVSTVRRPAADAVPIESMFLWVSYLEYRQKPSIRINYAKSIIGLTDQQFENWKHLYEQRTTPEQIVEYQRRLREKFTEALGGFPERTPLNPRITGTISRNDYTVEKIIFESQPKHYVTGILFLPNASKYNPPYPGVLVPCGHHPDGKHMTHIRLWGIVSS